MNPNAWHYWRPVMWLVSRKQRKIQEGQLRTEKVRRSLGYPLLQFVYPVIPGGYDTRYKFIRRVEGIDGVTGKRIKSPWGDKLNLNIDNTLRETVSGV